MLAEELQQINHIYSQAKCAKNGITTAKNFTDIANMKQVEFYDA